MAGLVASIVFVFCLFALGGSAAALWFADFPSDQLADYINASRVVLAAMLDGSSILANTLSTLVGLGTTSLARAMGPSMISSFAPYVSAGAIAGVGVGAVLLFLLRTIGKSRKEDFERKQQKEVMKAKPPVKIIKDKDAVDFGAGEISRKVENLSTFIFGGPGSGKTQMLRAYLTKALRRRQMGLCLDINGEHMQSLARKTDIMIGAFDKRSVSWSPLAEMKDEFDAQRVADALVTVTEGSSGAEWERYAQTLVGGILTVFWRLHESGERITNADLASFLADPDIDFLREHIGEDHPALAFLREDAAKGMVGSVLGVAASKGRAISALPPQAGFDGFSIERWVEENADKANAPFLWVPVPKKNKTAATSLAAMVAGFYVDACLTLAPDENRRCWFVCDELGQYPAIASIADALSLGRKYGMASVHACQAIAQLRAAYGREGSTVLLANYANYAIFRCNDTETANWAEQQIGKEVKKFKSKSKSSSSGDRSSTTSRSENEQRTIEARVLASSIQKMPSLTAQVFMVDKLDWQLVQGVRICKLPEPHTKVYVPRSGAEGSDQPLLKQRIREAREANSAPDIEDEAAGAGVDSGAPAYRREVIDKNEKCSEAVESPRKPKKGKPSGLDQIDELFN